MPAPNDNRRKIAHRRSGREPFEIGGQPGFPTGRHPVEADGEPVRMQGVAAEQEPASQGWRPAGFHPLEVCGAVAVVDLVPDDRVAGVGEMDPDLVHAPGFRPATDDREPSFRPLETPENMKLRVTFPAGGMHDLTDPDFGRPHLAGAEDRSGTAPSIAPGPTVNEGGVFLFDQPSLEGDAQFAGGAGVFRDDDQPAGIAVEAVHDGRARAVFDFISEQPFDAAEQGRLGSPVGGVDDEGSGFVDHEPIIRLVDDPEIDHHLKSRGHVGANENARGPACDPLAENSTGPEDQDL